MSEATSPADRQNAHRRKRVAKACQTCRAMKSKCDGKRPECGRCSGYGYRCVYSPGQPRHGAVALNGPGGLREEMEEYEKLATRLASKLSSLSERDEVSAALTRIKSRVNTALATIDDSLERRDHAPYRSSEPDMAWPPPVSQLHHGERYLGEVSDVQFFNLVKRVLQTQNGSPCPEQEVDSYEQDSDIASANAGTACRAIDLPGPDSVKSLTDVYFATIHLAYPFIPGSMFMRYLDDVPGPSESPSPASPNATQLALLYVLCAIGGYYNSFPGNQVEPNKAHEMYFLRALSLAPPSGMDRSIDYVTLLLAQCFYLLAVCRTDSCWTTLGQAVRTAQSIGLHVELHGASRDSRPEPLAAERRRRVWYSIYVLDRLLSLQLGRPPAIHDGDCDVPLPSRLGDCDIDWESGEMPEPPQGPCLGDYFQAVIAFSMIVGYVLRDLYSPRSDPRGGLCGTKELDQQLTQWKLGLPRALRFDLGHAFDQAFGYKRQRNMLAVKYHHLRALMYRPYLCYPLLRNMEPSSAALKVSDWSVIGLQEKICISEARAIARLLHSISSEKDLVHEFPWWQMISCLICAGSILLVSSIFTQPMDDGVDGLDPEGLLDDAETCLRVFEALSTNSTGARIARDMMGKLKEAGLKWRDAAGSGSSRGTGFLPGATQQTLALPSIDEQDRPLDDCSLPTPSNWPAEIVDSMAWSAQFFGAVYPGE